MFYCQKWLKICVFSSKIVQSLSPFPWGICAFFPWGMGNEIRVFSPYSSSCYSLGTTTSRMSVKSNLSVRNYLVLPIQQNFCRSLVRVSSTTPLQIHPCQKSKTMIFKNFHTFLEVERKDEAEAIENQLFVQNPLVFIIGILTKFLQKRMGVAKTCLEWTYCKTFYSNITQDTITVDFQSQLTILTIFNFFQNQNKRFCPLPG